MGSCQTHMLMKTMRSGAVSVPSPIADNAAQVSDLTFAACHFQIRRFA